MANEISNTDDIIDIREVIDRIEELESEIEADEISEENGATVQYDGEGEIKEDIATCGTCGKSWNDALITSRTPAPAARCPYESIHDEIAEHKALTALLEDCEGNGGDHQYQGAWYPVTLIRDEHFEDYARELAEDIGAIDREASWPNNYIDWTKAAEALQGDYTSVDFDGETYWVR